MTFKCFTHGFETESIQEWDDHNEKESHTISGVAPCSLCGFSTEFSFTGKHKARTVPCVCADCKKGLQ